VTYCVALLPGDGVGPEVTAEARNGDVGGDATTAEVGEAIAARPAAG
jgi:isocitrate/isopropylmalate dehydrogenase